MNELLINFKVKNLFEMTNFKKWSQKNSIKSISKELTVFSKKMLFVILIINLMVI